MSTAAVLRSAALVSVVFLAVFVLPVVAPAAGQTGSVQTAGSAAARVSATFRTPRGDPDLEGVWNLATATPMERPRELAGRETLTSQEAAEFEAEVRENASADRREAPARGEAGKPVTSAARSTAAELSPELRSAYNNFWYDENRVDGPEDRSLSERCIIGFDSGPLMTPSYYNNNARIVPLDGRRHLDPSVRQITGGARGHWENRTLVVETTNFTERTAFRASTGSVRLVEQFTRVDRDTLLYRFTVDDPAMWTRPWTAEFPMRKARDAIYEYACYEGNYGMSNILSAARADERAGAAVK